MFANPRRFSQLTTSFFAPGSQGIPHTPFVTFSRSKSLLSPASRLKTLELLFVVPNFYGLKNLLITDASF